MYYAMERMKKNGKRHKLRFAKLTPKRGIILVIVFILNSLITKSQYNDNSVYFCNGYNVSISNMRYNKYVYKTIQQKNTRKKTAQKYCCFGLANDKIYSILANQNPNSICFLNFLINDKDIILNFLLPYYSDNNEIKNEILYSYSENRDTVFRNLIEYDNKVIVDNEVYYYPLKDTTLRYVVISNLYLHRLNEFINLFKEKELLNEDCLINTNFLCNVKISIPLLEKKENVDCKKNGP